MLKKLTILTAVALVCLALVLILKKVDDQVVPSTATPHSQSDGAARRRESTFSRSTVTPLRNALGSDPGTIEIGESQVDLENARLRDVQRLTVEQIKVLTSAMSLSKKQQTELLSRLQAFHLTTEADGTTEYDIITSVLKPDQVESYEKYLDQKRRSDAALFASTRLHAIERVAGQLTEKQQDTIFQSIAATLITGEIVSDKEILKKTLTDDQYRRWLESSEAEPTNIDE